MNSQLSKNHAPGFEGMPPAESSATQIGQVDEHEVSELRQVSQSDDLKMRTDDLNAEITKLYNQVPNLPLTDSTAQSHCLELLYQAEKILAREPFGRKDVIDARLAVTRAEVEMGRGQASRRSFYIVVVVLYMFFFAIAALLLLGLRGPLGIGSAEAMNKHLAIGIPVPVWIWAIVGSLTSMLLRAGQFPFADVDEAKRWMVYRPVVGIIMGVMTYLMVAAGLIVFVGSSQTQVPELIWVIAFVGSFSDTLSVDLLNRLLGEFRTPESQAKPPSDKQGTEKAQGHGA